MNGGYAVAAVIMILLLYFAISYFNQDKKSIAVIFQGVIFFSSAASSRCFSRKRKRTGSSWRPQRYLCRKILSSGWALSTCCGGFQKYGFGTYIHQIDGYLSRKTNEEAQQNKRLIRIY